MTDEPPEGAVPGWYRAPGGGSKRYWDGHGWVAFAESRGDRQQTRRRIRRFIAAGGIAMLVLGVIGLALLTNEDAKFAPKAATVMAAAADRENTRRAAERKAEEDRIAAERANRASAVDQLEASVKTMAEGHVADGVFPGTVTAVACDPTDPASFDDLASAATVFGCLVTTGPDGAGERYHATIDWVAHNFTYGYGEP